MIRMLAGLFLLTAFARPAFALDPYPGLVYDFNYTPNHYVVNPTQKVPIYLTITNSASSTVNLTQALFYSLDIYPGSVAEENGPYAFDWTEETNLGGMNLAPGQSHTYNLAILRPIVGAVPFGTYSTAGAHMRVGGPLVQEQGGDSKTFSVTVVPEPSSVALLAVSLMGIAALRRCK